MADRLFIGNLPYTVDSAKLEEIFSQAGSVVSAQVVTDRMTGRSRGFGFVEMSSDEETQKALELNGHEVDDRKLVVNKARPREDRPQGGGFGGGRRDNRR